MTLDEFIDGYIWRSGIADEVDRTRSGFRFKDAPDIQHERVALPCSCGCDECDGWRMLSRAEIGDAVGLGSLASPDA